MAVYTTEEALDVILGDDFDSGDESEIEEDPSFLLPRPTDQESDSGREFDDEPPFCPPQKSDEPNSDINPESLTCRSRSSSPSMRGRGRGRRRGRGRGSRPRSRSGVEKSKMESHIKTPCNGQWEVADSATDVAPTLPPFTKTHGPRTTLGAEASALEFFSLFDDSVLDLLVEETNRLVENKHHCTITQIYIHVYTYTQLCLCENPNPAAFG